jgi:TonB-dependent starch-binding outer membrane protein SusC
LRTDRVSLTSILGYSAQENSSFNLNAAASGGPTDLIPTMNAAPLKENANSTTSGWGITSLFSRLNFSYDGKYLTSLSFRRDGSSRFGSDNRYAFFPAASVAWRISNEDFMDSFTNLDELKLRASYGRTGNQNIGNYVAQGTYNTGANYNGQAGVQAGGIPSSLSWETTDQVDVGFDLVMLRSRIDFSVTSTGKIPLAFCSVCLFQIIPDLAPIGLTWVK